MIDGVIGLVDMLLCVLFDVLWLDVGGVVLKVEWFVLVMLIEELVGEFWLFVDECGLWLVVYGGGYVVVMD